MTNVTLTKNLNRTKPGEVVIVPMGMFLPHAIKVSEVYDYEQPYCQTQIVAKGKAIKMPGCSEYRIGNTVEFVIGYRRRKQA